MSVLFEPCALTCTVCVTRCPQNTNELGREGEGGVSECVCGTGKWGGGGGGYDYFQYIYSPYLLLAYGSLFAGNVSTSVSEGVCCCVILSMPGTAGGGGGGGWGGKDGVVRRSPSMSTSSGCPLVLPQYMQLLLQKRQVSKFAHCITILQTELNRHS